MKKQLFGWVALAGALLATSCAKDVDAVAAKGEPTPVTFAVTLEEGIATRTISDGSQADILYYAAFDAATNAPVEDANGQTTVSDKTASVTLQLTAGKQYKVAFWAQNEACEAYTVALPNVTVNYTGAANNDEARDAFFAAATITAGEPVDAITLHRPFAQINFGVTTSEGKAYPEAPVTESALTVKSGAYTTLDVLTKAVSGDAGEVKFAAAALPQETLTVAEKEYTYLSMSYVLVDQENVNLEFDFGGGQTCSVPNAPVAMNHRTNVLATADPEEELVDVQFSVTIEPMYDGEDNVTVPAEPAEKPVITVSEVKAEYNEETGEVDFEATYAGEKESIKEAFFVWTPVQTRADEAEGGRVKATVEEGKLTASAKLNPGNYTITVEINGETAGESDAETSGAVNVPEETEEPEPEPEHGTTAEDPFTVAEAIAKAQEVGETATTEFYYIKGFVSSVGEQFSANFGNATFYMVDKGSADAFYAYRVFYKGPNQKWTTDDDLVNVGDEVIVCSQIMNYKGNTPETNNGYLYQIVTYAPTISNVAATVGEDGSSVTFKATYTNKSNIAFTKAGFKYGEKDVTVEVPTGTSGEITATETNVAPGSYTVKAYIDELESASAVMFTIKDPNAEGEEEDPIEIVFDFADKDNNPFSENQYYNTDKVTYKGYNWELKGISNNSKGWDFAKCGGKKDAGNDYAYINLTEPVDASIKTVTVNAKKGISGATAHAKLLVAQDANFQSIVETCAEQEITTTQGDITFIVSNPQKGYYYRVEFNNNNTTTSNGVTWLYNVKLNN